MIRVAYFFLRKAKDLGLGDYDLKNIEVIGDLRHIPDFKLPPLGGEAIFKNEAIQAMMTSRTTVRPKAYPDLCSGCGTGCRPVSCLGSFYGRCGSRKVGSRQMYNLFLLSGNLP